MNRKKNYGFGLIRDKAVPRFDDPQPKRAILGRIIEGVKSLIGIRDLPKSVRNILEKEGDQVITDIAVYRKPVDGVSTTFANVLTGGNWKEILKKSGIDKVFHTYAEINLENGKRYLLEKNQTIIMKPTPNGGSSGTETVSMRNQVKNKKITLAQFFENGRKQLGDDFIPYDAYENNCQSFLMGMLKGSSILTPEASTFLKQDLTKLVENTPSLSKIIAKGVVDFAGNVDNAVSAVMDKRGGIVLGKIKSKRFLMK
jgi:hypothetical protein